MRPALKFAVLVAAVVGPSGCFHFAGSGGPEAIDARKADDTKQNIGWIPGRGEVGIDVGYGFLTATVGAEDASKRGVKLGTSGDLHRRKLFGTAAIGAPVEGFCAPNDMATKNCGLVYLKSEYGTDQMTYSIAKDDGSLYSVHQSAVSRSLAIGWRKHMFGAVYSASQFYGGYFAEIFATRSVYDEAVISGDASASLSPYNGAAFGLRLGVFLDGRSYEWLANKAKRK